MTALNFRDALSGRDGTQPFTWALPVEPVFRDPTSALPLRTEHKAVRLPELRGVGERPVIEGPRGAVVAEVRRVPARPAAAGPGSVRQLASEAPRGIGTTTAATSANAFLQMPVDPRFAVQPVPMAPPLAVSAAPTPQLGPDRPAAATPARGTVAAGRQWQSRATGTRGSRKHGSTTQTLIAIIVLLVLLISGGISVIGSIIENFLR